MRVVLIFMSMAHSVVSVSIPSTSSLCPSSPFVKMSVQPASAMPGLPIELSSSQRALMAAGLVGSLQLVCPRGYTGAKAFVSPVRCMSGVPDIFDGRLVRMVSSFLSYTGDERETCPLSGGKRDWLLSDRCLFPWARSPVFALASLGFAPLLLCRVVRVELYNEHVSDIVLGPVGDQTRLAGPSLDVRNPTGVPFFVPGNLTVGSGGLESHLTNRVSGLLVGQLSGLANEARGMAMSLDILRRQLATLSTILKIHTREMSIEQGLEVLADARVKALVGGHPVATVADVNSLSAMILSVIDLSQDWSYVSGAPLSWLLSMEKFVKAFSLLSPMLSGLDVSGMEELSLTSEDWPTAMTLAIPKVGPNGLSTWDCPLLSQAFTNTKEYVLVKYVSDVIQKLATDVFVDAENPFESAVAAAKTFSPAFRPLYQAVVVSAAKANPCHDVLNVAGMMSAHQRLSLTQLSDWTAEQCRRIQVPFGYLSVVQATEEELSDIQRRVTVDCSSVFDANVQTVLAQFRAADSVAYVMSEGGGVLRAAQSVWDGLSTSQPMSGAFFITDSVVEGLVVPNIPAGASEGDSAALSYLFRKCVATKLSWWASMSTNTRTAFVNYA